MKITVDTEAMRLSAIVAKKKIMLTAIENIADLAEIIFISNLRYEVELYDSNNQVDIKEIPLLNKYRLMKNMTLDEASTEISERDLAIRTDMATSGMPIYKEIIDLKG